MGQSTISMAIFQFAFCMLKSVTFSNEDPLLATLTFWSAREALKHVFADIAKPGALVFARFRTSNWGRKWHCDLLGFTVFFL